MKVFDYLDSLIRELDKESGGSYRINPGDEAWQMYFTGNEYYENSSFITADRRADAEDFILAEKMWIEGNVIVVEYLGVEHEWEIPKELPMIKKYFEEVKNG